MDHFESIIATLLEAEGYWVRRSFKVNLTQEEKRRIGKYSIPRPEIDLLALRASTNEVIALEAKSYFDSPGVKIAELMASHDVPEGRYKLFTSERSEPLFFRACLRTWWLAAWPIHKPKFRWVLQRGMFIKAKARPYETS
jgi:hypothetical protein